MRLVRGNRLCAVGAAVAVGVVGGLAWGQQSQPGGYTDHKDPAEAPGASALWPAVEQALEAYNSQDPDQIEAFYLEHLPREVPPGDWARQQAMEWDEIYSQWGPMELAAAREYDEPREDVVAILWAPVIEAWRAIVFTPGEETTFFSLAFAQARAPSYLEADEPLSAEAAAERIDAMLDKLAERDMFSGTVLITKDGEVLLSRAVGLASRRFDVPNNMDTRFNMGSMNKMFTAVAVAQLVEAGKLSFDDFVGQHLPEFPNSEVREKVQIRHLLTHTSGLADYFTEEFILDSRASRREPMDYLDFFQDKPLQFEPGTDWSYSNAGFLMLGLIVEAASGETYYDYIRNHVYGPAGMTLSDSFDMDIPIKNLAVGYTRSPFGGYPDDGMRWLEENGGWRNNYFMHSIKGTGAGGGFSTAGDMTRFAEALYGGKLVSLEMVETLTTPKPDLSSPDYGFGFGRQELPGVGIRTGHSGGFPGINATLRMYPEAGVTFAAFANQDGGAELIGRRFEELIVWGR